MALRSSFLTSREIHDRAHQIADAFLHSASLDPFLPVQVNVTSFDMANLSNKKFVTRKPITVEKKNEVLRLSLNAEELRNTPQNVFQGWLELEIAHFLERSEKSSNDFNFQKQILPLMPVTGSSLNFIRELVELLCQSLERQSTMQMLFRMGKAESQVDYHFYTLTPSITEKKFYEKYEAHNWTRASYLCRKLVQYIGLSWLADHRVRHSHKLKMQWQEQHGYNGEDQTFIEEMATIANHHEDREFSIRLIEMFKVLRDTFLLKTCRETAVLDPKVLN